MNDKKIVYTALGFPIVLLGTRIKEVRGVKVPDLNLNTLQQAVFEALISKPSSLTGAEIRFIRSYLRLTQSEFAKTLNQSGHSIVSQWESKGLRSSGMDYNTEIWLRLNMARNLEKSELTEYLESFLEKTPFRADVKSTPIEIDFRKSA